MGTCPCSSKTKSLKRGVWEQIKIDQKKDRKKEGKKKKLKEIPDRN